MTGLHMDAITTEEHWLNSGNPEEMARIIEARSVDGRTVRRWQLFACACCWRIHPMLGDRSRQAVAIAERHAEGLALEEEIEDARHLAHSAVLTIWRPGTDACLASAAMAAHYAVVRPERAYHYAARAAGSGEAAERRAQANLLRDVFANPFRAIRFDPAWKTPTVLAIAEDIYLNDSFTEMSVLGDALEDAGCEEPIVLQHARLTSPHIRGCWLVDEVLAATHGVFIP